MVNNDTLQLVELCLTPRTGFPLHRYRELGLGLHVRKNRTKVKLQHHLRSRIRFNIYV